VVGERLASWHFGGTRAGWRLLLHRIGKGEPNQRG